MGEGSRASCFTKLSLVSIGKKTQTIKKTDDMLKKCEDVSAQQVQVQWESLCSAKILGTFFWLIFTFLLYSLIWKKPIFIEDWKLNYFWRDHDVDDFCGFIEMLTICPIDRISFRPFSFCSIKKENLISSVQFHLDLFLTTLENLWFFCHLVTLVFWVWMSSNWINSDERFSRHSLIEQMVTMR